MIKLHIWTGITKQTMGHNYYHFSIKLAEKKNIKKKLKQKKKKKHRRVVRLSTVHLNS